MVEAGRRRVRESSVDFPGLYFQSLEGVPAIQMYPLAEWDSTRYLKCTKTYHPPFKSTHQLHTGKDR